MIPEQLKKEKFRFIKVKPKEKIPIEKGWQEDKNYKFNDIFLAEHINNGGNYGVATGFGNLVVVDSDHEKTQELVEKHLPETFQVSTGKGIHNYFICKNLKKKIVLSEDEEGRHYGEVQTKTQQVVGAGSLHPNGHRYKVAKDVSIKEVSKEDIELALAPLMKQDSFKKKSSPIGKVCPPKQNFLKEGNRNDTLFKTACSFRSRSVPREDALRTLYTLNNASEQPLQPREVETLLNSAYRYSNVLGELDVKNYVANVEGFAEYQPFFYDKQKIFWLWNFDLCKWEEVDDTEILNLINSSLNMNGDVAKNTEKTNYINAFKMVGRKSCPKEAPKKWIQFQNKAFSLASGKIYDVQPNFFFTNPIPWEMGESSETPVMDKLFKDWVGEENVSLLYEIISYCCYADYPLQNIFCLFGSGRNGKSCFLKVLYNFLGKTNTCSTELDTLANPMRNRFETYKLRNKLACIMGETNFNVMNNSSMLKKLTGGDIIGIEKKGKDPLDMINYAKILVASNSLPISEDTSEGFYRRWIIVDFPNNFEEGGDIVATIPNEEYENLAKKVTEILPRLLENHKFTGVGTIEDRMNKYISCSNPIKEFFEEHCLLGNECYCQLTDLYKEYLAFLTNKKRRRVSRKEFSNILAQEGLFARRTTKEEISTFWLEGVTLKM